MVRLSLLVVFYTVLLSVCTSERLESFPFVWPASSLIEEYGNHNDGHSSMQPHRAHRSTPYSSRLYTYDIQSETSVACNGHCVSPDGSLQHILSEGLRRFHQTLERLKPSSSKGSSCHSTTSAHCQNLRHAQRKSQQHTVLQQLELEIYIATAETGLRPGVNESYQLLIQHNLYRNNDNTTTTSTNEEHDDDTVSIQLSAETVYGILRGLQTLWQLFQWDCCCSSCTLRLSKTLPIHIHDAPVYSYRGILIDTARHYLPLDLLLQQLQVMEYNKFNVWHWHLTDSQSFPWQSERHPELAEAGAYCPHCVYTADDIKMVVREAALRGIRVVVELDVPGHCNAMGQSHPELLTVCHDRPSEPLNATSEIMYDFLQELFDELTTLMPDPWMHLGGDEVPMDCWMQSGQIRNWMQRHNVGDRAVDLLTYFEGRVLNYVQKTLHKRPIVWQEPFDLGLPLSKDTIVDVWMLSNLTTIRHATKSGYDVILSACWYLDHLDTDWWGYYQCNPRQDFLGNATIEQQQRLIGGHASMWAEHVDATNFMSRVWPRASAVAEKLWTGTSRRDVVECTSQERLHRFRCHMRKLGVPAQPIVPGYCDGDEDDDDMLTA